LVALLLTSGQLAQALRAEDRAQVVDASLAQTPDIGALNLGDCLRDTDRGNWPPAFALVCADINAASVDAPTAPVRHDAPSSQVAKQAATSAARPVLDVGQPVGLRNTPLPMARPKKIVATERNTAPPMAASLPSCVIDERGGATVLNARSHKISSRIIAQNSRGRTAGVALLVPSACDVKSPMKAKVLFAGEFKGYRGVVILELSSKRRLIIAGLDALRVKRGDTVERGSFLGSTLPAGAPALVTAFNASIDRSQSLLFFDLRNSKGDGLNVFWLTDAG
jgi:hypothetical protein